MSAVNLSIKEYLVSTKLALDRAFHISLELLHFPTITCHIQCNGILSTLVLMSSILSKKVSELEKDKNTPKLTGCSVWVDKLLQRISANVAEKYFPDSSLYIKTFLEYKVPDITYSLPIVKAQ